MEITAALLDFQMRKKASDKGTQGEGLVVKDNQERGRNNTRNGSSENKSRSKSRRRKDIQCYKCGKKGHMKQECPNRKKGNDDKEGSSKSANVVKEQVLESSDGDMLSVSSNSKHLMDSWILDSACSFHVTLNKDWFDTYRLFNSALPSPKQNKSQSLILLGGDECGILREMINHHQNGPKVTNFREVGDEVKGDAFARSSKHW